MQAEAHPAYGDVWVHRKGATRAFPAGHPALAADVGGSSGHPVLIPGSNRDTRFILRPLPGAEKCGYSVNHGAGRRHLPRGGAAAARSAEGERPVPAPAGIVVNTDGEVPLDESAQCYKTAEEVVAAVVAAGLAEIEHHLLPLASIKGNEEGAARSSKRAKKARDKARDRDRDEARKNKPHY